MVDAGSLGRDSDAVHCNGGPVIGPEAAVYVSREDAKDLAESPWEFSRKTKKVRKSDRAPRRLCALWNPLRAFAASRETIVLPTIFLVEPYKLKTKRFSHSTKRTKQMLSTTSLLLSASTVSYSTSAPAISR